MLLLLVRRWDLLSRRLIFKGEFVFTFDWNSTNSADRYKLNICKSNFRFPATQESESETLSGDVGGQKTLRSYWRNYFEKTDALIWVVDATDRLRIDDCREELAGLLLEEVRFLLCISSSDLFISIYTLNTSLDHRLI
jgi:GTPase SAR1 family protein